MTKRKTPAKTSQNATKQLSESVEAKSNTVAAKTTKTSTNTSQKASTAKPRGRPKKALIEKKGNEIVYTEAGKQLLDETLATVSKAIDVDSRTVTYTSAGNAVPSKYEQFKAWLVFKLYVVTSYFRGY